jgi:putative endonuclease
VPDTRSLGRLFEDRAANFLLGKGFTLVTRRYSCRHGELDIVAMDGETVVFVEVKASNHSAWRPEENLDAKKTEHLFKAAERFLHEFGIEASESRFDVIAIDKDGLRHYQDVFGDSQP